MTSALCFASRRALGGGVGTQTRKLQGMQYRMRKNGTAKKPHKKYKTAKKVKKNGTKLENQSIKTANKKKLANYPHTAPSNQKKLCWSWLESGGLRSGIVIFKAS